MRSILLRGAVVAAVALTAACSSSDSVAPKPTGLRRSTTADAPATLTRALDWYYWNDCANGGAGEAMHTTGELRYDVQRTQDSAGVWHLSIKSNSSNLTATGLTTGDVYRGVMTERVNSRSVDYLNMDVRTADVIRFASTSGAGTYLLNAGTRIVVDGGEYRLFDMDYSVSCR